MTIIFKKYIISKLFDIFRQERKKKDVLINELYESYARGGFLSIGSIRSVRNMNGSRLIWKP